MDNDNIFKYVKDIFAGDSSGHDYWHTIRVYRNAMKIAEQEECNKDIVFLGALLHDVDDVKLFTTVNFENARTIMTKCEVDLSTINSVIEVIQSVSYKGNDSAVPKTIEGKIVQDADRIDAIGALGISRAFAYGGSIGRSMYDPEINPIMEMNAEEYRQNGGTTVSHCCIK